MTGPGDASAGVEGRERPHRILDRGEVRRIARLARLDLTEEEVGELARELASVLAHFEAIDAAAQAAPAPSEGDGARLRPDDPPSDPLHPGPEVWAPEWRDGFFLVPRLAAHQESEP